jgi:hypothetical protein
VVKVKVTKKLPKGAALDEKACSCAVENVTLPNATVFKPEVMEQKASETLGKEKCIGLDCRLGCQLPDEDCGRAPSPSWCGCQFFVPPAKKPCSGNGRQEGSSLCTCDEGWSGKECSVICSERGNMVGGRCLCDEGFNGPNCEGHVCSWHGERKSSKTHIGGLTFGGESDYVSLGMRSKPVAYTLEAWMKPAMAQAESAGVFHLDSLATDAPSPVGNNPILAYL